MTRDTLYLLDPHVRVEEGFARYCPDCALIEGYLAMYPQVRTQLQVLYVNPQRPRAEIVSLLGEDNQGAPVLLLHPQRERREREAVQNFHSQRFINDPPAICRYFALELGGGLPL